MRLTTIGTGTVSPTAHRVCAGHLVEAGEVRLLMDCGSGVLHRMAGLGVDWMGITHVALTHFHPDHICDLPLLVMAWRYGTMTKRTAPAEIVGPPGTALLLERLATAHGDWVLRPEFPVIVREVAPGDALELGCGVRIEARKVPHTEESVAYSLEHGGRRVVYTGDTGPDAALGAWAAGCDLLLAECSLPKEMAVPSHLTPEECGALAGAARPRRLVLTHLYPPVERVDIAGIVAASYDGPIHIATDGWLTEIGGT